MVIRVQQAEVDLAFVAQARAVGGDFVLIDQRDLCPAVRQLQRRSAASQTRAKNCHRRFVVLYQRPSQTVAIL